MLGPALIAGGLATIAYATVLTTLSVKHESADLEKIGRAFDLKSAMGLAVIISSVMLLSAALTARFGERGLVAAAALAGFADTHSAAISVASLVAANKIGLQDATLPIIVGLTTNTLTKALIASLSGGRQYAMQVIPGLILMIASIWSALRLGFIH